MAFVFACSTEFGWETAKQWSSATASSWQIPCGSVFASATPYRSQKLSRWGWGFESDSEMTKASHCQKKCGTARDWDCPKLIASVFRSVIGSASRWDYPTKSASEFLTVWG